MNFSITKQPSSVTMTNTDIFPDCIFKIDAVTDEILRIHTVADTNENPDFSFAIDTPPELNGSFTVTEAKDTLNISTSKINLKINQDMLIDIYNASGDLICSDTNSDSSAESDLSEEELNQLIAEGHLVDSAGDKFKYKVTKKIFGDEAFYGLGDKTGFLNKRGYDYIMWNSDNPDPHVENPTFRALYKTIPFFIVHSKDFTYGIFLDNTYKSTFDFGFAESDKYSFTVTNGELNYYFIYGESIKEVIENYTSLTGRCPLPQMWTLGYHQSRWSYSTEEEVLELAKNFRKYDIPCDAIHLDIDYMDNFKVFTSDDKKFPDFSGLSDKLKEMGIKLITIIDPGTKAEEGYHMYDEGIANGYFAKTPDGEVYHNTVWPGDSVFPCFTNSDVRSWWGKQTDILLKKGVRGIWNDMNEPASFNGPLPNDVVFHGDDKDYLHEEIHNVYGHLMAKATYEGLKENDGRRPFVITRACYSGSQKYTTAWTGDNQSLWSHLKFAIPQVLNMGMSGMPFVGVDIGGFGAHTTPELLSRWIEACCFSPLFRNHSAKMTRRQEPWAFDENTLNIYRKFVKLRYKFVPYLYDLFYEESITGVPVLRPLIMEYENDPNVVNCNDEYLVGASILVAPVTDQGATTRSVYLPKGVWVDYNTGKRISGNRHILYNAPIDVCPMFVKAGSIIPTFPDISSLDEENTNKLVIEFYPDGNNDSSCYYLHYQDNGADFNYENGEYNIYKFKFSSNKPTGLKVQMVNEAYKKYDSITAVAK